MLPKSIFSSHQSRLIDSRHAPARAIIWWKIGRRPLTACLGNAGEAGGASVGADAECRLCDGRGAPLRRQHRAPAGVLRGAMCALQRVDSARRRGGPDPAGCTARPAAAGRTAIDPAFAYTHAAPAVVIVQGAAGHVGSHRSDCNELSSPAAAASAVQARH